MCIGLSLPLIRLFDPGSPQSLMGNDPPENDSIPVLFDRFFLLVPPAKVSFPPRPPSISFIGVPLL